MSAELAALAGVSAQGLVNHYENTKQFERDRSNMYLQQKLQMENLQQAPLRMAEGYKQAGLNPASISGTSFSAPATTTHPAPYNPADYANPIVNALSQRSIESQIAKTEAETEAQRLKNIETRDKMATIDINLRNYMQKLIDEGHPRSEDIQTILDTNDLLTSGSLSGLAEFDNYLTNLDQSRTNMAVNATLRAVEKYKQDNDAARIIAQVPARERDKFISELLKVYGEIAKLSADTDLSKQKILESATHVDQMIADSNLTYHKDFAAMIHNKDYSSAFLGLLSSALNAAAGAAPLVALKGPRSGKKALDTIRNIPSPKPAFPHPEGYRRY